MPEMLGFVLGAALMYRIGRGIQYQCMSGEQVHVCIDVDRDGDAITGTVAVRNGEARTFSGRLGLFSAIDDAIEGIGPRDLHEGTEDVQQ